MLYTYLILVFYTVTTTTAEGTNEEPDLTILTSPSGPQYPAATWIRIACRQNNYSNPQALKYRWTGKCNSTGLTVFDITDPFLDEQSWAIIWAKSTPVNCLDFFQCTSYHLNGDEIASEKIILDQISGVGMSLPDNFFLGTLPNNSAVVVLNNTRNAQEIICHSASKSNCITQWVGPAGSLSRCSEQISDELVVFNSARLNLNKITKEGLYTCITEDENSQEQKLYIGIYKSVPQLRVEPDYRVTNKGLILECGAKGPPSTATLWSRNGVLLTFTGDDNDQTTGLSSSVDRSGGHYRSRLMLSGVEKGVFSCDVLSDWVATDKRNSGRQSAGSYFVVHPLSANITMECVFPEGITNLNWTNRRTNTETVRLMTGPMNTTAVISLTLTQEVHGHTYVCQGVDSRGTLKYKHYKVIAKVPSESLILRTEKLATAPLTGQPITMKCCANKSIDSIESQPILNWHRDGLLLTEEDFNIQPSRNGQETCLTLSFESLLMEDGGQYVCTASLQSSRRKDIIVQRQEVILQPSEKRMEPEKGPDNVILITTITVTSSVLLIGTILIGIIFFALWKRRHTTKCEKTSTTNKTDT